MRGPAIVFDQVTVRYQTGEPPALQGVCLTVAPGERVGLLGLNGSGKTTLLMAAAGLVSHEGRIQVCGQQVSRATLARVRQEIGFLFNVPEDQLLFPKVIEDAAFALLRQGVDPREAFAAAGQTLGSLGIADLAESPLHHLSHGQKQRVSLAGALVTHPPLLLLDEPSAGLDPPAKQGLIRTLRSLDAAMLVATHDLDWASDLCSRLILLDRGRVVLDGTDVQTVRRMWSQAQRG